MAYIVISNLKISEAVIEAEEGGFCLVKLPDTGARFRVRKSRIHANEGGGNGALKKPPSARLLSHPLSQRNTL